MITFRILQVMHMKSAVVFVAFHWDNDFTLSIWRWNHFGREWRALWTWIHIWEQSHCSASVSPVLGMYISAWAIDMGHSKCNIRCQKRHLVWLRGLPDYRVMFGYLQLVTAGHQTRLETALQRAHTVPLGMQGARVLHKLHKTAADTDSASRVHRPVDW